MLRSSYSARKSYASIVALTAIFVLCLVTPSKSKAQSTREWAPPANAWIAPTALKWRASSEFRVRAALATASPAGQAANEQTTGARYEPDCNDPDAHDLNCVEPTRANIQRAYALGYPYYIGHAEPTAEFFSTRPHSGDNMQWKFQLPASEPTPTQSGTKVANFELFTTIWLGLDLCDPNSNPFGSCVAASDSNNPATAGAAFLELQFYPPGINCASGTKWCVSLHINTLQNNNAFQVKNCNEPTTAALLTTNGKAGGPTFFMSNGDTVIVKIFDTANGLETDVTDVTASTSGSMVASSANGFVHNSDKTTCATTGFNFHPMYATASPGQVVPWAAIQPNVALDFEIGHFELCGDAACTIPPDGGDADETGTCSVTKSQKCTKKSDCPAAETCQNGCGTDRGIGGCFGADLDHDGTPYLADWPDGDTTNHPASLIVGSADDKGIGPLTSNNEGYPTLTFVSSEATNGAFYPFYSQAGTGSSCRFNFGNDIPGTTTDDFGKVAQYGTTISNPCLPGTYSDLAIKKTAPSSVIAGTNLVYTIVITNNGPSDATNLVLTDTLPAGVVLGPITGPNFSSCTLASHTVTCKPGNLSDGSSATYTIQVHIPSAGAGSSPITNTATISADQLDPNQANNTSSASTAVKFQADLSITKSVSPNPAAAGTSLSYTIKIQNSGPSDAAATVVTDTLPAGFVFVSGPCSGTTVLTCAPGTITAGSSKTFAINVSIPADYLSSRGETSATVVNTAKVVSSASDPNTGNNSASRSVNVIALTDLDLTVTVSPNPVHQGGIVTYTMHFNDTGPSDAIQGFILDYIPQGIKFVGSSVLPCGPGVGTVLCNLGPVVPANFALSFPVQFQVPSNFLNPGETSRTVTSTLSISSHTIDSDAGDGPLVVPVTVIP